MGIEECDCMIFQMKSKNTTHNQKWNEILNSSLNNKCQVNTSESKNVFVQKSIDICLFFIDNYGRMESTVCTQRTNTPFAYSL